MAGLKVQVDRAATAALSSSREPLEVLMRESLTLPLVPTSSARVTVPLSLLRAALTGYWGVAQPLASARATVRITPGFAAGVAGPGSAAGAGVAGCGAVSVETSARTTSGGGGWRTGTSTGGAITWGGAV